MTPTLPALFLVLAPLAAGQVPTPITQSAPTLCPAMSGLEIGQSRAAAYDLLWRKSPQKPVLGHEINVLFTPRERRYSVDVKFDDDTRDARIAALHYVFDPPPGLYDSIRTRFGPETAPSGDPALHVWNVPSCGVQIRYRVQLSERQRPLMEELWIDRLPVLPQKPAPRRKP